VPFRIQRPARGLNDLLSIFGGGTPSELEDRVRGTIELVQFYALNQRQVATTSNGALVEGNALVLVPSASQWVVLFDLTCTIVKTATMTALRGATFIRYNNDQNQEAAIASEELGPFGATETGAVTVTGGLYYPRLLPPGSAVGCRCQIIGTDANASVILGANFGVVGP